MIVIVENIRTHQRHRRRCNQLQLRMLLFDCFVELCESSIVRTRFIVVLLIANLP